MNTIIYDLETTGLDFNKDKIIEAYFYNINTKKSLHLMINPQCQIKPEISQIHNIFDKDLIDMPIFEKVFPKILDFCGEYAYLISHNNINFDKPFILSEIKRINYPIPKFWKYIDTVRIARIIYPKLENYKQDTLRKHLHISCQGNHRACKDVLDLVKIYTQMVGNTSINEIYNLSNTFLYKKMPFGKYRNKPLTEIPSHYINWLTRTVFPKDKLLKRSFKQFLKNKNINSNI